ncbi:MAG: glutathione synthetase [Longimicrobiales bacterium]
MRIGFVVNDVMTEDHRFTTTRLALGALRRGHEAWSMGVGDFIYDPDGTISAHARSVRGSRYKTTKTYLDALQGTEAVEERIQLNDLDVLLLRSDPAEDTMERPWAQTSGILFGQLAVRSGVIVLNDPYSLANAINKTYFQHFPEAVRPLTLITRDPDEVRAFVKEHDGNVVLKPLQGSGGHNVFLVRRKDGSNLNQIVDAILRDGYVVVQEYLREAEAGDIRLFVMNGEPLMHEGKYAAFGRVSVSDDIRSNMSAGGKVVRPKLDDRVFELVEMVRPKLIQDGMFLVGLDIVGDKLMEINVFSPGGLGSAESVHEVDFAAPVIEAIERKLNYTRCYDDQPLSNLNLATL